MGVMNENKCKLLESDINLIYFSYFPRKIVHLKITIFYIFFFSNNYPSKSFNHPSQIRKIKFSY